MQAYYIAQPALQFGTLLVELLAKDPKPVQVVIVSAFADRNAAIRLRKPIRSLKDGGARIRIITGIDLQGTSLEALTEILSWEVDSHIVRNLLSGHTFHPKIYLLRRRDCADLIVGSNNLTGGGLFNNYEAAVRISYEFPDDADAYSEMVKRFEIFRDCSIITEPF